MSWVAGRRSMAELLAARPSLAALVGPLRRDARAGAPGRSAALITARVEQIVNGHGTLDGFGTLSDGEQVVLAVTEQFLLDAHAIDDSMIGALSRHYSPADLVAIMFHLALVDGFTKFNRVFDAQPEIEPETEIEIEVDVGVGVNVPLGKDVS